MSEVKDSYNSSDPLSGRPKSCQKTGLSNVLINFSDHLFDIIFVVETKKTDMLPKKCPIKGTLGTN